MMSLPCGESLCGTYSLQPYFVEDIIECDMQRSNLYMIDMVMLQNREKEIFLCEWFDSTSSECIYSIPSLDEIAIL